MSRVLKAALPKARIEITVTARKSWCTDCDSRALASGPRFGVRYAYRIDLGNKRIQPFAAFNW